MKSTIKITLIIFSVFLTQSCKDNILGLYGKSQDSSPDNNTNNNTNNNNKNRKKPLLKALKAKGKKQLNKKPYVKNKTQTGNKPDSEKIEIENDLLNKKTVNQSIPMFLAFGVCSNTII